MPSYSKELSFGLDIGDRSIKALQFTEKNKKTILEGFAEVALENGIVRGGDILDPDGLIAHLRGLLKKGGIAGEQVVLAIPEAKTFLKLLNVPMPKRGDVKSAAAIELRRHIPYDLAEVVWDMSIISSTETAYSVLTGAVPKKISLSYSNTLMRAGLTPILFDLESLAIARALMPANEPAGCVLILEIGATKSTLVLASSQSVLSTSDARHSGDELTERIIKAMKISEKSAREMKHQYGLDHSSAHYRETVNGYLSDIVSRIQQFLSFTLTHETLCGGVSKIMLSGGGALLKGLPEALTGALKIPVRLGDPWINTHDSIGVKIGEGASVRFATVAGLALSALSYAHSS